MFKFFGTLNNVLKFNFLIFYCKQVPRSIRGFLTSFIIPFFLTHGASRARFGAMNCSHERILERDMVLIHIWKPKAISWESKQEVSFVLSRTEFGLSTNILQSWGDFMFLPSLLSWNLLSNTVVINVSQVPGKFSSYLVCRSTR